MHSFYDFVSIYFLQYAPAVFNVIEKDAFRLIGDATVTWIASIRVTRPDAESAIPVRCLWCHRYRHLSYSARQSWDPRPKIPPQVLRYHVIVVKKNACQPVISVTEIWIVLGGRTSGIVVRKLLIHIFVQSIFFIKLKITRVNSNCCKIISVKNVVLNYYKKYIILF